MASAARKESEAFELKWLVVSDLVVDPRIQRPFNPNWCEARKDAIDLDLIGTLAVWYTGGKYVVIDGMHRKGLMELAGFGSWKVPCRVFHGSLAEASRAFIALNDHRRVDYLTIFKNRVNAGETAAKAVAAIATELGLRVAGGNSPSHIQAARSLDRVYRHGGGEHARALRLCLSVAKGAWNLAPDSFHGAVVEGLGLVFIRYGATIDADDLTAKLAKNGTPSKLIGQARSWRDSHGGSLAHALAGVVVNLYNRGRRVGKVEEWR